MIKNFQKELITVEIQLLIIKMKRAINLNGIDKELELSKVIANR